jgi:hypothetical protein
LEAPQAAVGEEEAASPEEEDDGCSFAGVLQSPEHRALPSPVGGGDVHKLPPKSPLDLRLCLRGRGREARGHGAGLHRAVPE